MPMGPDDGYGAPPSKKPEPRGGAAGTAQRQHSAPPVMDTAIPMAADFPTAPEPTRPVTTSAPVVAAATPAEAEQVGLPVAAIYKDPGKVHAIEPDGSQLTLDKMTQDHWVALKKQLGLTGMTESLAASITLEAVDTGRLSFHYTQAQRAVLTEVHRERISGALEHYFNATLEVEFTEQKQTRETPFEYSQRKRAERLARAVADMKNDPIVQHLISQFDGRLELDTIVPIDPTEEN